ncbi:LAQU0S10e00958g1_1 [Lachancea quebecensis]|uniref:LAQU0S10e00958g1_1 n=1 Tax=Lachancea quebecensis TaxID=1654605 RepID=A0A0P1KUB2_9SACH|nr:LAQU0S10e00958g1_1 [Lachancea quebecensis]
MDKIKQEGATRPSIFDSSPTKTPPSVGKTREENNSRSALKEKTVNIQAILKKPAPADEQKDRNASKHFQDRDLPSQSAPTGTIKGFKSAVKAEPPSVFLTHPVPTSKQDLAQSPTVKKQKLDQTPSPALLVKQEVAPLTPNMPPAHKQTKDNSKAKASARMPSSDPGLYKPVVSALHEVNPVVETREYYCEVFREVQNDTERSACVDFAKMDLNSWISAGHVLQQEHAAILGRLVEARMRLNGKFKVITDLINDRAAALNAQGNILDQKLRRIQDLGKEILDII